MPAALRFVAAPGLVLTKLSENENSWYSSASTTVPESFCFNPAAAEFLLGAGILEEAPEMVTVELTREDAERYAQMGASPAGHVSRLTAACRKALDQLPF